MNEKLTAELKEFSEVTVAVTTVLCPALIVALEGESVTANDVTGAVPVPVSGTLCGDVGALSAMDRLADSAACVEGLNVTLTVQPLPPAKVPPGAPQVSVSEKSAAFVPVKLKVMPVNWAEPVLVNVTFIAGLAVP